MTSREIGCEQKTCQVLLAARSGENAIALKTLLETQGTVRQCEPTIAAVSATASAEVDLIVLTEEVLAQAQAIEQLAGYLNEQPDWSDIGVIVLLKSVKDFGGAIAQIGALTDHRGLLPLELPLKRPIFSAMVRMCLQDRQRQYALRSTLFQLQQSNQTLENFSYTAAHELRNPLGVITTGLQILTRSPLEEKPKKIAERGLQTARSMNQTISALLDYGKVQSLQNEFAPVDMTGVVKAALVSLCVLVSDAKADVVYGEMPTVLGNQQLLIQLVSNLIKNAIVHSEVDRPRVTIAATEVVSQMANIGARPSRWRISVADNGKGIAAEAQEKIFEMFNRAGKSRAEGSGIGLALCQRIVEQHGGTIGVKSELGEGSEFYFDLPCTDVIALYLEPDPTEVNR